MKEQQKIEEARGFKNLTIEQLQDMFIKDARDFVKLVQEQGPFFRMKIIRDHMVIVKEEIELRLYNSKPQ